MAQATNDGFMGEPSVLVGVKTSLFYGRVKRDISIGWLLLKKGRRTGTSAAELLESIELGERYRGAHCAVELVMCPGRATSCRGLGLE